MGRRIHSLIALAVVTVVGFACHCPTPVVPPDVEPAADPNTPPEGVDAKDYVALDSAAQACVVLKALKCPEGLVADCPGEIRKLREIGTFEAPNLLCIRQSRTVTRVRTCAVDCVQ